MSLAALLKDADPLSAWSTEKARFKKILVAVAALLAVLTAAVLAFKPSPRESHASAVGQQQTLAALMAVRQEAQALNEKVDRIPTADSRPTREAGAAPSTVQIFERDVGEGFSNLHMERGQPYIPTGAVFLAEILTPIKTSLERTFVLAETTHEYRMDSTRRIPKRSRLTGRAFLNPVLKGVVVEFDNLVLPNGQETPLRGLALSRDALPEIDGLYFSNSLENYGTALAFGFLSGFSGAAREREITPFGTIPEVNLTNQVLGGLSTASFQVADEILRDIRTRAVEYVVVPAGERIFVALTARYEIPPRMAP